MLDNLWQGKIRESNNDAIQNKGILVPKLALGPFLTLSVRNGHKLHERLGF